MPVWQSLYNLTQQMVCSHRTILDADLEILGRWLDKPFVNQSSYQSQLGEKQKYIFHNCMTAAACRTLITSSQMDFVIWYVTLWFTWLDLMWWESSWFARESFEGFTFERRKHHFDQRSSYFYFLFNIYFSQNFIQISCFLCFWCPWSVILRSLSNYIYSF